MNDTSGRDVLVAARRERERRALTLSLWFSIVLGVAAVLVGLLTGTRIIVFDGAYMGIGLLLTWISLRAARAAAGGPTPRFPFGRDALAPLVVVIQGLALAGTLIAAAGDAIIVIRDGGTPVEPWTIGIYGALTAAFGFAIALWLPRAAPQSDLVAAEVAQWRAGAGLSLVMVVGAVAAGVLGATPARGLVEFVDPVLVLVACAMLATIPLRLIRSGVNELLEGAPTAEMAAEIDRAVLAVQQRFGLPEPVVRAGKVGQKVYLEVDFVIDAAEWDVRAEDEVRRAVLDGLAHLGMDVWASVSLTADIDLT